MTRLQTRFVMPILSQITELSIKTKLIIPPSRGSALQVSSVQKDVASL